MCEQRLEALGMLRRRRAKCAVGSPEHHRNAYLATEHVAEFRGLIDDLVHRAHGELDEAHRCDGAQARDRRSDAGRDDVASEIGMSMTRSDAELVEKPAKLPEAAAPTDVLADDDDPVVAPHRILHGLERCLAEGDLRASRCEHPLERAAGIRVGALLCESLRIVDFGEGIAPDARTRLGVSAPSESKRASSRGIGSCSLQAATSSFILYSSASPTKCPPNRYVSRLRKVGPSPPRAASTASDAACTTAPASLPSTVTPAIP